MTSRDWQFAFGDLGDPIADIKDWMLPPFKQEGNHEPQNTQDTQIRTNDVPH